MQMKRLLLGLLVFLSAVSIAHAQTTFTFPSSGVCSSTATPPEYCYLASNQTTGTSVSVTFNWSGNFTVVGQTISATWVWVNTYIGTSTDTATDQLQDSGLWQLAYDGNEPSTCDLSTVKLVSSIPWVLQLQADCQMAMNSGASLHVVANKFLTRQYVSGKYGRNHFAFTIDPGTSLPGTVVTN